MTRERPSVVLAGMQRQQTGSGAMDAVPAETTGETSLLRRRLRIVFLVLIGVYAVARVRKPEYWDPLDDLNLAVHEAGHVVFSVFGETLAILGGSAFQVMVPLAFVAYFVRTKQRYAAAVTMTWVGVSLLNVARYIGDARAQNLPLLGGEDSIHDWWYLLINWDLLKSDLQIGGFVQFLAAMVFVIAILLGAAVIYNDAQSARSSPPTPHPQLKP